jgi:hypothetical protein
MSKCRRILAVASSGGHWIQLRRMQSAFPSGETVWVSTSEGHRGEIEGDAFEVVPDCNRWEKIAVVRSAFRMLLLVLRRRPTHVVTTGAAPGYFALVFGRLIGAKTVWIDSVANAETLSLSGQQARRWAHEVWTQWPELVASADGNLVEVSCHGSVL